MYTYFEMQDGSVIRTQNPEYWTENKRITKKEGERRLAEKARDQLREFYPPGATVHTVLKHVSKSGMYRHIDVIAVQNGEPRNVSGLVSQACGFKLTDRGSIGISGCGMDMGFAIAYDLSRTLYRDGFECIGDKCSSNDHSNGDRNRKPHKHGDGGYALRHSWL